MKIEIHSDGVGFDSEKEYRICTELYDIQDLKSNNIVDNRELMFQKRYSWNEEQIQGFIKKYHRYITENSNFMPGAKTVLKLLKEEGHSLIIITARGGINKDLIPLTEEILKQNNMDIFDKYYWSTSNKSEICIKEKIDLMIDDSNHNCKKIAENKIKTIYLKDAPSYEIEETEYIKTLYNWGEIYRYIKEIEK